MGSGGLPTASIRIVIPKGLCMSADIEDQLVLFVTILAPRRSGGSCPIDIHDASSWF